MSATVLVVDDDAVSRGLVVELLREAGHRVLPAGGGKEALAAAADAERIDVVISDVNLPGLGGRRVAAAIGALHPAARVIYVSGYPPAHVAEQGIVTDAQTFLAKPFALDELRRAVDRALGR